MCDSLNLNHHQACLRKYTRKKNLNSEKKEPRYIQHEYQESYKINMDKKTKIRGGSSKKTTR